MKTISVYEAVETVLAHGGLCRNCKIFTYPNCSFGKAL